MPRTSDRTATSLPFFSFRGWLTVIVILALCLRLYKLTEPLADWHSFRQADTASVTREYVKHGIDLLRPRYHDLSNIQSGMNVGGKDNVDGWRMVEFPLINGMLAFILRTFPGLDLVIVSRLASIGASLVSLIVFTFLIKEIFSSKVALLSAAIMATLPYAVFYSRVILPEPFYIALALSSAWVYFQSRKNHALMLGFLSAFLFSLALLVKPMAIFFVPFFIGIRITTGERLTRKDVVVGFFFLASAVPMSLWRQWIQQFPTGIPVSDWLYNGGGPQNALSPLYRIRFRPAWWRWIFYERLTKLFLGYAGQLFFISGILSLLRTRSRKERGQALIAGSLGLGSLAYVVVFAAGNVQHDYYQAPLVPMVSLFVAMGIAAIARFLHGKISFIYILCILSIPLAIMYFYAWKQVQGYYSINNWAIVRAGIAADSLLPADAKVIAPYQGDTAFLFQINRTGWPIGFEIEKKISEGAGYYVSVNYDDEARDLEKKYRTVAKTPEYIIIDLHEKL